MAMIKYLMNNRHEEAVMEDNIIYNLITFKINEKLVFIHL